MGNIDSLHLMFINPYLCCGETGTKLALIECPNSPESVINRWIVSMFRNQCYQCYKSTKKAWRSENIFSPLPSYIWWNSNKSSFVIIVFFVLVMTGSLWSGNIWSVVRKHWSFLFQTCEEIMDRSSPLITPEKCYITLQYTITHWDSLPSSLPS